MEQSVNQNVAPDSALGTRKRKRAGLIACIIIVFCSIGFSIYGVIEVNHKVSEISDLKAQAEKKDEVIAELGSCKSEDGKDAENTTIDTDESTISGGPYIKDGYFFVPDWKLKFRIPDELANYGYSVDYDTAHVGYTMPMVGFTAMLKTDELQNAQMAYYDNIQTCSMVSVSKESGVWPSNRRINGVIKQFNNYALLIWNYSSHGSCDYNLHIDEVQEKIQTMFANPEDI